MSRRQPLAAACVLAVLAVTACSSSAPATSPAPAGSSAAQAGQPDTEAGVRSAATQFYALYAASLWPQAWQMLTAASQKAAPEATYVAVHQGCPSPSAGMARVIKAVTMAGSTAVVTETVSGAAGALGSVTDAWSYSGGRWGIALDQTAMAVYSHGSAAADLAAAKAAGECAGTPAALPTFATVAPATVQPPPAPPTFATMATVPVPSMSPPAAFPTS